MAKASIALQSELSKAYETIDRLEASIKEMEKRFQDQENVLVHTQNLLTKHLNREMQFDIFIKRNKEIEERIRSLNISMETL